ncbi:MAG TPA: GNAT family N-acetyltransferase [Pirellulales bacterium]|nr:GNAT family N-acetyltransferase [Pirellulales bacterium]
MSAEDRRRVAADKRRPVRSESQRTQPVRKPSRQNAPHEHRHGSRDKASPLVALDGVSRLAAPSATNGTRRGDPAAPPPVWQVVEARAGDHPSIYQWLLAVFHAPTREEFHAEQDDPTYEPVNRLLVKRGSRIVSHAQLIDRTMLFGSLRLPIDQVAWLGTLPEFRRQGAATALLEAVDAKMRRDGAVLGLLRTRVPHFFHRAGWAVCGRHCFSQAKARDILARYWAEPALRRDPLNLRLWRHFELPALMRIYAQNTSEAFGPLARGETYWRWLISRGAFDHIIIALAGPDRLDLNEAGAPIVGYAVVRQERVVELLTNPAYPTAGVQLLARACSDAIERRGNEIVLEAPPCDPLHRFMTSAGGEFRHHESDDQEVFMIKLLDPAGFLNGLSGLLDARSRAAGVPRNCELGLLAGADKFLFTMSRNGLKIVRGRLGRSHVACSGSEFTRLLLGHDSPEESAAQGRLTASTQLALELAGILFPRLPTWRPLLDDLTI